jgi:uncharacterized protein with HEPN domain
LFEKPDREWRMYVQDIQASAQKIVRYTDGLTFEAFCGDTMVYDATLRNFELMGEAANHIPVHVRDAHPQIAWREMINLRNKLIHGYLGIDDEVVWDVIKNDLPSLLVNLAAVKASSVG